MIITKQKLLELIDETIIKTSEACGRTLSFKDRFRIKEALFKRAEGVKNGVNKKAATKATY